MLHSGCQRWKSLGFWKVNFAKVVEVWREWKGCMEIFWKAMTFFWKARTIRVSLTWKNSRKYIHDAMYFWWGRFRLTDLLSGSNWHNFIWTNDTCYLSTLKVNKYDTHFWRIEFFWKKEENVPRSTDHRCMRPDRFNPSMQYAPYPLTQHLLQHCNCSWHGNSFTHYINEA